MNALICVLFHSSVIQLLLLSFVRCEYRKLSDTLTDIADNREKIVKIFRKVSTLNILLKNYDQPEGILNSLGNVFQLGEQSFVVFNLKSEKSYSEWMKNCREFKDDKFVRSAYYERLYQKPHQAPKLKLAFSSFEDSERREKGLSDDLIDPQASIASQPVVRSGSLSESFANSLDSWFSYRKAGFILFCTFSALELYLGCLLSRSGTFLFIIDSEKENTTLRELCDVLNASWKASTNPKLSVLIFSEIYVLNPFEIDGTTKSFGTLVKLSDEEIKQDFRNLNRYPMNVDLFYSAYSITRNESFTGKLDSFRGPDVKVASFIEEQMNVSSN